MPVTKTKDASDSVARAVRHLTQSYVVVGIPDSAAERKPVEGEKSTPPSNATIGYAMEFGLPEKNIPARPFLVPGSASVQDQAAMLLVKAGEAALTGQPSAVEAGLARLGQTVASAVQRTLTDGPFAPLSLRTIEARARRTKGGTKGAKKYLNLLAQGTPKEVLDDLGGQALIRPLIDTGQLRRSITFAVRSK